MSLRNWCQLLFVHKMSESSVLLLYLYSFLNNLYSTSDILSKDVNFVWPLWHFITISDFYGCIPIICQKIKVCEVSWRSNNYKYIYLTFKVIDFLPTCMTLFTLPRYVMILSTSFYVKYNMAPLFYLLIITNFFLITY